MLEILAKAIVLGAVITILAAFAVIGILILLNCIVWLTKLLAIGSSL